MVVGRSDHGYSIASNQSTLQALWSIERVSHKCKRTDWTRLKSVCFQGLSSWDNSGETPTRSQHTGECQWSSNDGRWSSTLLPFDCICSVLFEERNDLWAWRISLPKVCVRNLPPQVLRGQPTYTHVEPVWSLHVFSLYRYLSTTEWESRKQSCKYRLFKSFSWRWLSLDLYIWHVLFIISSFSCSCRFCRLAMHWCLVVFLTHGSSIHIYTHCRLFQQDTLIDGSTDSLFCGNLAIELSQNGRALRWIWVVTIDMLMKLTVA